MGEAIFPNCKIFAEILIIENIKRVLILCSWQYFSAKWTTALRAKKRLSSLFFSLKHLAVWGLQACNFTKKRIQHRFFPVKFAKSLKTLYTYFEENLLTAALDFRSMFPFIQYSRYLYSNCNKKTESIERKGNAGLK